MHKCVSAVVTSAMCLPATLSHFVQLREPAQPTKPAAFPMPKIFNKYAPQKSAAKPGLWGGGLAAQQRVKWVKLHIHRS